MLMRFCLSLVLLVLLWVPSGADAAHKAHAATPLVTADWLARHQGDTGLRILDLRRDPQAIQKTHVPGSVPTHYGQDGWRVVRNGIPGMLPPAKDVEALIQRLGVSNDTHVVLVPQGASASEMGIATRIYWTFKVMGHDKVSILNGGFSAYEQDASRPVASGSPAAVEPGTFQATFRPALLATEADVQAALKGGAVTLIDNRPPPQFTGKTKPGPVTRPGTVPGAKNVPSVWTTGPDGGTFKSEADLRAMFETAGAATEGDLINFCNTGHWASTGWFITSEILGNKTAKLYDGSMSEWTRTAENPVVVEGQ